VPSYPIWYWTTSGKSAERRAQPQGVHRDGCPVRRGQGDRVVAAAVHGGEPAKWHSRGIRAGGDRDRVGWLDLRRGPADIVPEVAPGPGSTAVIDEALRILLDGLTGTR